MSKHAKGRKGRMFRETMFDEYDSEHDEENVIENTQNPTSSLSRARGGG